MIVDFRTYTLSVGYVPKFLELFENIGLPIQKKILGNFLAMFKHEFGNTNEIIHMWGYESFQDREKRRSECAKNEEFLAYVKEARQYIIKQEVKLLIPTPSSPILRVKS
ncbi:MAG: hypothetical protein CFH01_00848 [Alphaproteobacteria bacterium MarineAlpha2_Bin1]|nr:MAG: hypothetical protein CFH01_00848 [Alphaproteobacteria bacterium MarineAlpha2_Bin1]